MYELASPTAASFVLEIMTKIKIVLHHIQTFRFTFTGMTVFTPKITSVPISIFLGIDPLVMPDKSCWKFKNQTQRWTFFFLGGGGGYIIAADFKKLRYEVTIGFFGSKISISN